MLALPTSMRIHNVFHVYLLKRHIPSLNHMIDWTMIHVDHKGDFQVHPMCIMDHKFKVIKNKSIGILKVQWELYGIKDSMWEHKETTQEEYSQCFASFEEK
jgi:hypothetical protein